MKWALVKWWLRPTNTIVIDAEDSVATNPDGDADRAGGAKDSLGTISRIQRYLSRRWTDQISRTVSSFDSEAQLMMMDDLGPDDRLSGEHSIGEGLTEIAETLSAAALPVVSGRPASDPGFHEQHSEHHQSGPTHLLRVPEHTTKAAMSMTAPIIPTLQQQQKQQENTETAHFDTSEISNPVIAAALQRYERQRSRSNSARSAGRRPHSSGSSGGGGGRNSNSVLVEEEDADWLQERGRKGKDWLWRRTGSGGEAEYRNSSSMERSRTRQ